MYLPSIPLLLPLFILAACSPRAPTTRDPGSPTPVAQESPTGETAQAVPRQEDLAASPGMPVRADQAPLVGVRDALETDSLLGKRVRVAGRCTAASDSRRTGSWILTASDAAIEVRGRVPTTCSSEQGLTIFAQIEPKTSGGRDRLLLRLPD